DDPKDGFYGLLSQTIERSPRLGCEPVLHLLYRVIGIRCGRIGAKRSAGDRLCESRLLASNGVIPAFSQAATLAALKKPVSPSK
ncbi:MAG: hypothetical protein ACI9J5_003700, partial [Paraglaciecola sp.]